MLARARQWLMVIAVGLLVSGVALPAMAQVVAANCKETAGLTHRATVCLRTTIDNGVVHYFGTVTAFLQNSINAAITLAVVLYGVLLSFGMVEKLGRDTFIALFKVAAVIYFTANTPLIFSTMISLMDGTALAVTTFVPPSGTVDATSASDFSKIKCLQNITKEGSKPANPAPAASPWLGVDCVLDSVIGIKVPLNAGDPVPAFPAVYFNETLDSATNPTNSNPGMSRGLLNFFFSSLQTSVIGMVLAVVGAVFILGICMLIIRAFFVYIMGYMGIAFLTIVSPLFIPMILFKETKQYFDKWARLMISFALQPVLMLVFIMMTITAIDLAVFSGNYSIMYRIAGNESRNTNFDLNEYLTRPRTTGTSPENCSTECQGIITNRLKPLAEIKAAVTPKTEGTAPSVSSPAVSLKQDSGGLVDGLLYTKCTPELIKADTTGFLKEFCGFVYPMAVWSHDVQWERMALARVPAVVIPAGYTQVKDAAGNPSANLTKAQIIMREVLASCFLCLMVVFIMNGMVAIIPTLIGDLIADFGQGPNLLSKVGDMGNQAGGMASQYAKSAQSMVTKR